MIVQILCVFATISMSIIIINEFKCMKNDELEFRKCSRLKCDSNNWIVYYFELIVLKPLTRMERKKNHWCDIIHSFWGWRLLFALVDGGVATVVTCHKSGNGTKLVYPLLPLSELIATVKLEYPNEFSFSFTTAVAIWIVEWYVDINAAFLMSFLLTSKKKVG